MYLTLVAEMFGLVRNQQGQVTRRCEYNERFLTGLSFFMREMMILIKNNLQNTCKIAKKVLIL